MRLSGDDVDQAPTIRSAKWDSTLRLMDYLNRKWADATARGQSEVQLKFPTQLVLLLHDALRHMIDHKMPLYRLHVDAEEYSRSMLASAAMAETTIQEVAIRASELMADMETGVLQMVERAIGKPAVRGQQARQRGQHMTAAMLALPS